jgi:hypothetical protein
VEKLSEQFKKLGRFTELHVEGQTRNTIFTQMQDKTHMPKENAFIQI